jgi:hypothetical protein
MVFRRVQKLTRTDIKCSACGYDLRGSYDPAILVTECPECGAVYDNDDLLVAPIVQQVEQSHRDERWVLRVGIGAMAIAVFAALIGANIPTVRNLWGGLGCLGIGCAAFLLFIFGFNVLQGSRTLDREHPALGRLLFRFGPKIPGAGLWYSLAFASWIVCSIVGVIAVFVWDPNWGVAAAGAGFAGYVAFIAWHWWRNRRKS